MFDIKEKKHSSKSKNHVDPFLFLSKRQVYIKELLFRQEEEQKKTAKEIHDDLGQVLTALKMEVFDKKKCSSASNCKKNCCLSKSFDKIIFLIEKMTKSIRCLSKELRPPLLDNLGLVEAVKYHCSDFKKNFSGDCLASIEDIPSISLDSSVNLFRILQEALNNVLQRAQASKVFVFLRKEGNNITLRVEDNGIGFFSKNKNSSSMGIVGIKERAAIYRGKVSIKKPKGENGFIMEVSIPIRNMIEQFVFQRKE